MRICRSRPDFCERGRIGLRIRTHDRFAYGTGKGEAFRNGSFGLERNNHVQPATAGCLHPGSELQRREHLAHELGRLDDLLPRHRRTWIEIPHDPVRTFDIIGGRVPGVDFDNAHLRERYDGLDRIRDEVSPTLVFSWIRTRVAHLGPMLWRASESCKALRFLPGNEPTLEA